MVGLSTAEKAQMQHLIDAQAVRLATTGPLPALDSPPKPRGRSAPDHCDECEAAVLENHPVGSVCPQCDLEEMAAYQRLCDTCSVASNRCPGCGAVLEMEVEVSQDLTSCLDSEPHHEPGYQHQRLSHLLDGAGHQESGSETAVVLPQRASGRPPRPPRMTAQGPRA